MATWTKREKSVRTVEYLIPAAEPWGAALQDVQSATAAAKAHWRQLNPGKETAGDTLRFHVEDDRIVISFTIDSN